MIAILLSCVTDSASPSAQASLTLAHGWSAAPWEQAARSPELHIEGTFDLGAAPGGGSVLVVEGAWWQLTATVNGTTLPPVTGGLTEAHIPVGPQLRAGENTLSLRIAAPVGVDPILTGGSLSSVNKHKGIAMLQAPPRLLLRPSAHIDAAWLQAVGDTIRPHATTSGAPADATVRFWVSLDGKILAELGENALVEGQVEAPAVSAALPRWAVGEASLLYLHAELRDADGTRLDEAIVRTGIRELTSSPLSLDGTALRLMGARVVNQSPQTSLPDTMASFAPAGINAAEIHGETFRRDWLDEADELGLPVVIVPRCIGRSNQYSGDQDALLATMTQQDTRTAALLRTHPAVVLLAAEGPPPPNMPLWTNALTASGIPIAGHDLPARMLALKAGESIDETTVRCQPKNCQGAWLVELAPWWRTAAEGNKPESTTRWRLLSEALITFMTEHGSIGAIVPSPNPREVVGWEDAWQSTAAALSIPAVLGSGRGRSEVLVRGAMPGETVWLSAPTTPTVGAIADSSGTARLSLWHDGTATVTIGEKTLSVELEPGRWKQFSWESAVVEVAL